MPIPANTKNKILETIFNLGTHGATIKEIESESEYERHTLSKYLSIMESMGLIHHRKVGKATLWYVDNAPLETVLNSNTVNKRKKTFAEQVLMNIITNLPIGLLIISNDYSIEYMNSIMEKAYNLKRGDKFYKVVLGEENPLQVEKITEIIEHKHEIASLVVEDINKNILHLRASKMFNPNGSESVILMIRDITYSKKAEFGLIKTKGELEHKVKGGIVRLKEEKMHLKESEQKFRAIFENSPEGMLVADPFTKRLVQTNPSICRMTGYTERELLQLSIEKLHRQRDLPILIRKLMLANPSFSKLRDYTIKELLTLDATKIFPKLVKEFEEKGKLNLGILTNIPLLRKDRKIIYCDIHNTIINIQRHNYILGFFKQVK